MICVLTAQGRLHPSQPATPLVSQGETGYPQEIESIVNARCLSCHAGATGGGGLVLNTWEHLMAGSSYGEAVIPFDADNSLLLEMATKLAGGPHPRELGGEMLTDRELAILRRWIADGARSSTGEVPFAEASQRLLVGSQDEALVSVIDMESNVVIHTIDLQELGFSATAKPHHIATEPDGSFFYVSLIADGKVLKFNSAYELVGQADFETPGMMALHPTEDLLYVGRSMAAVNPPMRIGEIRRSDMEIDEIDVFFPRPHAIAVEPHGAYAYTASLAENQVVTVNTDTREAQFTAIDGPTHTFVQFAISPDGNTMVAATQLTGKILVFDIGSSPIATLVDSIAVNAAPWHPAFSPDGRYVYVGNKNANTVTAVDMTTRSVAAVIEGRGLAQPHGLAVSPDGRYLYVSNNNLRGEYTPRYDLGDNELSGTVTVINTSTYTIEKVIEVERYASGVATLITN
ncbi:MAG: beta-propeller fold lactonase family protein [Gemmatimonadetes bacterium]|nr:beta-propeller fold lactonase family protein [Gemmatimonadota bacterium]